MLAFTELMIGPTYSALQKFLDNLLNLQNLYSHIIQVIQRKRTSFQQKLMLGIKQYGSKIRPNVSLGLIFDPYCLLRVFKINTFFEIVRKYFILFKNFWRALYVMFLYVFFRERHHHIPTARSTRTSTRDW